MTTTGIESLYPFLYPGADVHSGELLADVARSTAEKAHEIVHLRRTLAVEYGDRLVACARRLAEAFEAGGTLYTFGNGGSSTDAEDLSHLFLHPPPGRRPLPAISLTQDVAVLTALSNDVGYDLVFARQLAAFAGTGDIAVGLSTSGGSTNVLHGFEEATRRGMLSIGLAGGDGGPMAEPGRVDFLFVVPSASVHRVQEGQTTLYHVLWELTQQALDGRL